jgi:tRNA threonylcarbamoyladenosine biosynthesis protein TsaE
VVLEGGLGAGKTFLVRAILRAAGAGDRVTSPTFVLAQEYETPKGLFVHADLYRLIGGRVSLAAEVARLGLHDRRREGAVVVAEWGAAGVEALGGEPSLVVTLSIEGSNSRAAALSGPRAGDIV